MTQGERIVYPVYPGIKIRMKLSSTVEGSVHPVPEAELIQC